MREIALPAGTFFHNSPVGVSKSGALAPMVVETIKTNIKIGESFISKISKNTIAENSIPVERWVL